MRKGIIDRFEGEYAIVELKINQIRRMYLDPFYRRKLA